MRHKKTGIVLITILIVFILSITLISFRVKTQVKDLFRMNKELQEDGYYMGDFEFKMMSLTYYLDKGQYIEALLSINKLHNQMERKDGITKMPKFNSKQEELTFYLNLQDPETGAFIEKKYPYLVYNEISENIIDHIVSLSKEINQQAKLKYPLTYLDEISPPTKLKAFLNDVGYVGRIATKFPQTSYIFARSLLSYINNEGAIGENNFYSFSQEWKTSLLERFYDSQDPETGFRGPRSRTDGKLLKKDLTNTVSVIKTLIDKDGNNIYKEFPLRYSDKIIATTIEVLNEPVPDNEELDEVHERNLKMSRGISMITRYLWKYMSEDDKQEFKKTIEKYIKIKFEKNYIPGEGAFSYYPNEKYATLDGMGNFFLFKDLGAFSPERQRQLWGDSKGNIVNLGIKQLYEFNETDFAPITDTGINSIRIYTITPEDNFSENIKMIFYPKETSVLDIMDLSFKVKQRVQNTTKTMGNRTSKDTTLQELESLNIKDIPAYNTIPTEQLNTLLNNNNEVIAVGFDILQVPRDQITFELKR